MKIALATGNYRNVVGHPGKCKGFIVFEIEDEKIINKEERENSFQHGHDHSCNHEHSHDHSHDHSQQGHGNLGNQLRKCYKTATILLQNQWDRVL